MLPPAGMKQSKSPAAQTKWNRRQDLLLNCLRKSSKSDNNGSRNYKQRVTSVTRQRSVVAGLVVGPVSPPIHQARHAFPPKPHLTRVKHTFILITSATGSFVTSFKASAKKQAFSRRRLQARKNGKLQRIDSRRRMRTSTTSSMVHRTSSPTKPKCLLWTWSART